MAEPRKRRKRAVLVLAIVLVLLTHYVSCWLGMHWLLGHGDISLQTASNLQSTVFSPPAMYCREEMPGHRFILDVATWMENRGAGSDYAWAEIRSRWDPEKAEAIRKRREQAQHAK